MTKTPEYTKRAIANYQKTKERVTVLFDKGTKEAIVNKYGPDVQISTYVKKLVDKDLKEPTAAKDPDFPF